jgi:hypothetical protein
MMDGEGGWKWKTQEPAWQVSFGSKLQNMTICASHWLIVPALPKLGKVAEPRSASSVIMACARR